ncbi:MAG TPA: ABC transporter permease [Thermoanaerobaculia bacterium]|nr:ABC transporter permease [Thermoanaerobaculia bacterium]
MSEAQTTVAPWWIEALRGISREVVQLYRYRQLIAALTSRDLKARYRGSVLGFVWSLANPLMLLCVYTLVFTRFFPRPDLSPYPLFLFAGILPWTFFASSVLEATTAISGNGSLIKKVMFPAEALPLVVVLSHLVHFVLALPILLGALLIFALVGKAPLTMVILLTPVLLFLQAVFVAGFAFMISSAAVLFRDLRDLVANLLQLGFFLTPIIYLFGGVKSAPIRGALWLNPMTAFVTAFQDIYFFGRSPSALDFFLMIFWATLSFSLGFLVFDRLRDTLAEAI